MTSIVALSASLIWLLIIVVINKPCLARNTYKVPNPCIEVLHSKGLRVCIPDSNGIELFAFHGKINEEMEHLEAGDMSQDVIRKNGDRWVFQDNNVRVRDGDTIYYWLFVIRDGLGYRYDNGVYRVTSGSASCPCSDTSSSSSESSTSSSIDRPSIQSHTTTNPRFPTTSYPRYPTTDASSICEGTLVNLTRTMVALQEEASELRENNSILRGLVEKEPRAAKWLGLTGVIPSGGDPRDIVQGVVTEKLRLGVSVVSAERKEDSSISFEVQTLEDKMKIINAARTRLADSRIILVY